MSSNLDSLGKLTLVYMVRILQESLNARERTIRDLDLVCSNLINENKMLTRSNESLKDALNDYKEACDMHYQKLEELNNPKTIPCPPWDEWESFMDNGYGWVG